MKAYTPAPDSLAARVIHTLTEGAIGTLTPGEIATCFKVPRASVSNTLKAAVQHGHLTHYSGGRGKVVYHLPGTTVTLDEAPTAKAQLVPAIRKKAATKKKARRAATQRAPATQNPGPAAPMQPPAIAALWDDGDFVLYGLTINSDETVTMTGEQAQRLHRFLERVYGPNE
jgi:hypothetical protein